MTPDQIYYPPQQTPCCVCGVPAVITAEGKAWCRQCLDESGVKLENGGEIVLKNKRDVHGLRGKPPIEAHHFWCGVCQKVPEKVGISFASADTGVRGSRKPASGPEVLDCYEGYVSGFAECHGQFCEIYASYENAWLALDHGKPIVLFSDALTIEDSPQQEKQIGGDEPLTIDV